MTMQSNAYTSPLGTEGKAHSPRQQLISPVIQNLANFLDVEVDCITLADKLDEVLWRYSSYMLRDTELVGHPDNICELYYLRELRNILLGKPKA